MSLVHSCYYRHISLKTRILSNPQNRQLAAKNGAGEGNRTLVISLEGWSFTTKLHPLKPPQNPSVKNLIKTRFHNYRTLQSRIMVGRSGFEPLKAKADGVTVRSLWPLGHLPSHQQEPIKGWGKLQQPLKDKPKSGQPVHELAVGIEPTTPGLQNRNSTVELR